MTDNPNPPVQKRNGRPPGTGKVESHPQFGLILQLFMEGRGAFYISKRVKPALSKSALLDFQRFRFKKAIEKAKETPLSMVQALQSKGLLEDNEQVAEVVAQATVQLVGADKLLARIQKNYDRVDELIDEQMEPEKDKDGKNKKRNVGAVCALIGLDRSLIETEARMTHIMDAPMTGVQINIITPQSPTANIKSPIVQIGTKAT